MSTLFPLRRLARAAALLTIVLLLTACDQLTYVWVKPGASQAEFNVDEGTCKERGLMLFPPNMQQVEVEHRDTRTQQTKCVSADNSGSTRCAKTDEIRSTPQTKLVDVNLQARQEEVKACLQTHGWQFMSVADQKRLMRNP